MADIDPKDLFFTQTDLDLQQAVKFTENALHGADDGELYLERGNNNISISYFIISND